MEQFNHLNDERRIRALKHNLVFNPGKRKTMASRRRRPRGTDRSMHVVIKSDLAKGSLNLRRHHDKIRRLIFRIGYKRKVRVYRIVNVGNHIHMSLRLVNVSSWKGFISGITGGIASIVGFKKSPSHPTFWNSRPFTRAVNWGRDYRQLKDYFAYNFLQTTGLIPLNKPKNWRKVVALFADEFLARRARSQFENRVVPKLR